MIGASLFVVGLLLVLTGLTSTRSGEATEASPDAALPAAGGATRSRLGGPDWAHHRVRSLLLAPIDPVSWSANGALLAGFWIAVISFATLAGLASSGATLLFVGVGVVIAGFGIEIARVVARIERRRVALTDGRPLYPHPYRSYGTSLREFLIAEFGDVNRWRDVLYVGVNLPLAILELAVALAIWVLALGLLTMPLWYDANASASLPPALGWLGARTPALAAGRSLAGLALLPVAAATSQGLMALQRAVVAGLLCVSESRELERRVATLTESRSAVLDVEASELRRIERDLHDGAQQRLVMLTIDLSLAAERIESSPEDARKLVYDAREQARQALAELRDLVRGIAPAILLDRGLVAALGAVAARCPVPAVVESGLPEGARLPPAIERAAYFVVAEALANVAKHSSASRCEVRCRAESRVVAGRVQAGGDRGRGRSADTPSREERLVVEVWDDGSGGAQICPGGGLAGLVGRVEALDGSLEVESPAGGPTLLRAAFPLPAYPPRRGW